jgi:hypothetical protein
MTFGCIAGAFLGIAFIIPLRKHMIDFERLTYPGRVAVATILKSPGAGVQKAVVLLGSAVVSASVHLLTIGFEFDNWDLGSLFGLTTYMNGIWYLSLMTVGVGFIAGRGGVAFIIGGFVAYWFLSPMLAATGGFPIDRIDVSRAHKQIPGLSDHGGFPDHFLTDILTFAVVRDWAAYGNFGGKRLPIECARRFNLGAGCTTRQEHAHDGENRDCLACNAAVFFCFICASRCHRLSPIGVHLRRLPRR